jgi:dTDP-4-amino-4,6-dideoxygalactose transaminase
LQQAYQSLGMVQGQYPVAEQYAQQVLSLPIGPQMSDEEVIRTIEAVRSFY